jgi:hypothetical protein
MNYSDFKVTWIPDGSLGNWKVRTVSSKCILMKGDVIWMTDDDIEIEEAKEFVDNAQGRVLISGLGIGMIPAYLSKQEMIESIDIIEKEKDVIDLIAPSLLQKFDKITIHHGDSLTWDFRDMKWDWAYHDIWEVHPTEEQAQHIMERYNGIVDNQLYWKKHA